MDTTTILREMLAAVPFRPFAVCVSDGRKLRVDDPAFLLITPHGRIVWEGNGPKDEFAIVTAAGVTGIESV